MEEHLWEIKHKLYIIFVLISENWSIKGGIPQCSSHTYNIYFDNNMLHSMSFRSLFLHVGPFIKKSTAPVASTTCPKWSHMMNLQPPWLVWRKKRVVRRQKKKIPITIYLINLPGVPSILRWQVACVLDHSCCALNFRLWADKTHH